MPVFAFAEETARREGVGISRRSLARLFGTYVPPELVAEMARDPSRYDMRAENRMLSIMFCDMRNFTLVSEMPHGGFKESGYGKDQSMYALEDYTVAKHVMVRSE